MSHNAVGMEAIVLLEGLDCLLALGSQDTIGNSIGIVQQVKEVLEQIDVRPATSLAEYGTISHARDGKAQEKTKDEYTHSATKQILHPP